MLTIKPFRKRKKSSVVSLVALVFRFIYFISFYLDYSLRRAPVANCYVNKKDIVLFAEIRGKEDAAQHPGKTFIIPALPFNSPRLAIAIIRVADGAKRSRTDGQSQLIPRIINFFI